MGREVRRVPPNWDHPVIKQRIGLGYQPMHAQRFEDAAREWKEGLAAWERGEFPDCCNDEDRRLEFWEWHGEPPDRAYYRPWADEEATWFQVWETVSEGTPVTPPFATQEELVDYLVAHGDFWDQARRREGRTGMPCGPWDRAAAERFVTAGWAPSMVVTRDATGVDIKMPRDGI